MPFQPESFGLIKSRSIMDIYESIVEIRYLVGTLGINNTIRYLEQTDPENVWIEILKETRQTDNPI